MPASSKKFSREPNELRAVKPHSSLQERPRLLGVGMVPLATVFLALWMAYNFAGLVSLPTAAALVAGGAFVWAVRRARRADDYAVEGFVLSVAAPARYPGRPRLGERPRAPRRAIPEHLTS